MNRRFSATLLSWIVFTVAAPFTSGASAQSVFLCDPPCADGAECNSGECNAAAEGVQVETSAESQVAVELTSAACVPSCRAGYGCEVGVCVALPGVACTPACRAGYSCQSGTCVTNAAQAVPVQAVPVQAVPVQAVPVVSLQPVAAYPTEPAPPGPAATRRLDRKIRLSFFSAVRVGGGYVIENGVVGDMDPGFGVGLRLEFPLGRHIVLGPMLQYSSLSDSVSDDRYNLVAPSLWFGVRRVFEFGPGGLEIYLGLPVGYTWLGYEQDDGEEDSTSVVDSGFHVGVLGGVRLFFGSTFGLMLETGFIRDGIIAPDVGRFTYTQIQASVNLGISLGF